MLRSVNVCGASSPTADWYGAAGGVAIVGSFADSGSSQSSTIPCGSSIVQLSVSLEAVSHECGHTLGLSHDGRAAAHEEYYEGQGSGATGWAPIMGASYYQPVTQWCKGEYADANNHEDQIAIIAGSRNGFGFARDSAGDTPQTALPLVFSNNRITYTDALETTGDVDTFRITPIAGPLHITVKGDTDAPNADLGLTLLDKDEHVVSSSNPVDDLSASIDATVTVNTYYIQVTRGR